MPTRLCHIDKDGQKTAFKRGNQMSYSSSKRIATLQPVVSIWSVDRIARRIVGIANITLILAAYFISSYFIIGLCFVNLNLVFTSVTDNCPFKKLLIRLGAKEREEFFKGNGELISVKNEKAHQTNFQNSENV